MGDSSKSNITIIIGSHSSGKTTRALDIINTNEKCLFISLDFDRKMSRLVEDLENIKYLQIRNCFLIDIEFAVINNKCETLIIDGLNFINMAQKNVNQFEEIVKSIEYLSSTYDLKIIGTLNTLKNVDYIKENAKKIIKERGCNLIKTNYKSLANSKIAL
jgi:thymidine kinase